jgi:hypothetical protein
VLGELHVKSPDSDQLMSAHRIRAVERDGINAYRFHIRDNHFQALGTKFHVDGRGTEDLKISCECGWTWPSE